ncbi:MAG: leucine-rich repeat domain-containing protein [Spirochaetaceae bacterium]|nr:leucine-rich repeat domain-containing protein [Spirochaetaceae bacterium]
MAFADNQLASVIIPNNITHIGEQAFVSNQLASVTIPNSVVHIGAGAFAFNQLTSVTIPNSVTHIGAGAFFGNQLSSVVIGDNVIHIGINAFAENQLTSATIFSFTVFALLNEVRNLREKFLKLGKDETQEPFARAKAIYDLSILYVEMGWLAQVLEPLGMAKAYYESFLRE